MISAPLSIMVFYSSDFVESIYILQLFTVGCYFRYLAWPFQYVLPSLGKSDQYLVTQTLVDVVHLLGTIVLILFFCLKGASIGFIGGNFMYVLIMYFVSQKSLGWIFCRTDWANIIFGITIILLAIYLCIYCGVVGYVLAVLIFIGSSLISMARLALQLGEDDATGRLLNKLLLGVSYRHYL